MCHRQHLNALLTFLVLPVMFGLEPQHYTVRYVLFNIRVRRRSTTGSMHVSIDQPLGIHKKKKTTSISMMTSHLQHHPSPATLRVGSLNVHQFYNGHSERTFAGICDLLRLADLDLIGLQEASGALLPPLVAQLNATNTKANTEYALAAKFGGTAIVTRLRIVRNVSAAQKKPGEGRYSCCRVLLPSSVDTSEEEDALNQEEIFHIAVVHLDHRKESHRLKEIHAIVHDLTETHHLPLFDFWLGDFNALTASDYTQEEWNLIAAIRSQNCWEQPVSDLTSGMTSSAPVLAKRNKKRKALGSLGLQDAFLSVLPHSRSGPLGTSRFDTRIDYVFYNRQRLSTAGWTIVSCQHIDCKDLSDHNLVVATFEKRASEP